MSHSPQSLGWHLRYYIINVIELSIIKDIINPYILQSQMTIFYLCEVKTSHFSHVQLFVTPWTVAWQASVSKACPTLCDSTDCSMPGFPVLHYFPNVCSNSCPYESMMLSNSLILCHSLLFLPTIFPSIRSFPTSWLTASSGQLEHQL